MNRDGRRVLLLAVASVAALAVAHGISSSMVLPRLHASEIPTGWWLLSIAPLIVVVILAGVLCTAAVKVPLYSLAVAFPPTLLQAGRGIARATDPGLWVAVGVRIVVCAVWLGLFMVRPLSSRLGGWAANGA